jgi:hypothetical protein
MGAWGVAVFSDDLAADLRVEFREMIGEGLTSTQAVEKLIAEYASSQTDPDEMPVFWIALACTQWKLGRLEERTRQQTIHVIDSGCDLNRWDDSKLRKKRAAVLKKIRQELLSPQPPARRVRRTIKETNDWSVGEVIGLRLLSGSWTLMRVIGHHEDKGGRYAICELLDWVGEEVPSVKMISELPVKKGISVRGTSQFMFQQPRKKSDVLRVQRLGIDSAPSQQPCGYAVLVWPYVDKLLEKLFGLR